MRLHEKNAKMRNTHQNIKIFDIKMAQNSKFPKKALRVESCISEGTNAIVSKFFSDDHQRYEQKICEIQRCARNTSCKT